MLARACALTRPIPSRPRRTISSARKGDETWIVCVITVRLTARLAGERPRILPLIDDQAGGWTKLAAHEPDEGRFACAV